MTEFKIPRTPEERRAYILANTTAKTDGAADLDESVEEHVAAQKQKGPTVAPARPRAKRLP